MPAENRPPPTARRFFRILTFGCKVNQCDSAGMSQELAGRGWLSAPPGVVADLHLVNTCTVTGRADQQARQAIRRLFREYPATPIWVTGCYAQRAPAELAALPGVQAVLGNREKGELAKLWEKFAPGAHPKLWVDTCPGRQPFQPWRLRGFPGHTRAWLKIQEGCSHGCSYCIVPQVRGPRRSWPPAGVAAALGELAAAGYQEVVLTGIDLGQYGQDLDPSFSLAGLVRRLKEDGAALRVRLSSLEPQGITGELLTELASWRNFCPHFHLPLQSGSHPILRAMNRPYRPGEFRDLVLKIARLFPEAALGLDVLVGFPGESAADFEASQNLVASLPVTYLHVFPFSARPGTPAARLKAVPGRELRRRAGIIRELGRQKRLAFIQGQTQRLREVLVEGPAPQPGWLQGLSDNYLRVVFPGPAAWRNRRLLVRFLGLKEERLLGEALVGPNEPGENPSCGINS